MAEAQRVLGYRSTDSQGRGLRRELEAREKRSGKQFLTRSVGAKRTRVCVTVAAVRKHAPDLLPKRAERMVRAALEALAESRQKDRELLATDTERIVAPLVRRIEKLEETVRVLRSRVG